MNRLGRWSAFLTAVFAAAFIGIGIFGTPYTDPVPYPYVVSSINPVDYAWLYPAFLLAPTLVALMACIHYYAADDKKVFSLIALSFILIYAVVITIDFFIQWTVVLPSMLRGETEGLALFTQYNPHGLFVALESLAYLMLNAGLAAAAAVFAGGRLERALRWLFVGGFVAAVGSFAAFSLLGYEIVLFEVAVITVSCVVLVVSGLLLSLVFKRAGQAGSSGAVGG